MKRIVRLPVEVANAANVFINVTDHHNNAVANIPGDGAGVLAYQEAETDTFMLRRIKEGAGIAVTELAGEILIEAKLSNSFESQEDTVAATAKALNDLKIHLEGLIRVCL
jgi:hypothetical protein